MKKIKQTFNNNFKNILTIAEIGVNHDGKLHKAFKLIENAKKAGFQAAKFQVYKLKIYLSPKLRWQNIKRKESVIPICLTC